MTNNQTIKKLSLSDRSRLLARYLASPHILWTMLFIIAPLFFVVYYAFTNVDGAFTFANIKLIADWYYLKIFLYSLSFALCATLICLLLAYPVAYFISRMDGRTQKLIIMLIMLPMWVNFVIRTYALMRILDNNGVMDSIFSAIAGKSVEIGIINTPLAIIIGMVYDYLPYMILPIYSVMTKIDYRLIEASRDLGADGKHTLFKVILPLSKSGIVSGIIMVFVPSVSTFYISEKLGGGQYPMLGDKIEAEFMRNSNYHLGASLALVLMVLILISLTLLMRFGEKDNGGIAV